MAITKEQYFEYFHLIDDNDNFSKNRKRGLISILNVCNATYENVDFHDVEDLCYDDGMHLLSDKEKIAYEINNILKCINPKDKKNKKQLSTIYYAFLMGGDETELKKEITLLQCDLGMDAQFISVFPAILCDLKVNKNLMNSCNINKKTYTR